MNYSHAEMLKALAVPARPINDDDWGSERQITAENLFWERFEACVSKSKMIEHERYNLKATSEEMLDFALATIKEETAQLVPIKAESWAMGTSRELGMWGIRNLDNGKSRWESWALSKLDEGKAAKRENWVMRNLSDGKPRLWKIWKMGNPDNGKSGEWVNWVKREICIKGM